ncbi:MAG: hypothetical protein FJX56_09030, partial [Alphaproteobacteria bacterium]|nr:hypothetical protein [Alphaproteobacteria bacterium]
MATDDTAHPQVRVFRLRNRLREKVNGLAARGRGSIPDELLQIAGSELARIVASYPDHLATMIATLARAVAAAQAVSPASR